VCVINCTSFFLAINYFDCSGSYLTAHHRKAKTTTATAGRGAGGGPEISHRFRCFNPVTGTLPQHTRESIHINNI
jgi:hypothetical protein